MIYSHKDKDLVLFEYSDGQGNDLPLSRHCCPPLLFKADTSLGSAIAPEILNGTSANKLEMEHELRAGVNHLAQKSSIPSPGLLEQPAVFLVVALALLLLAWCARRAFRGTRSRSGSDPPKLRSSDAAFLDVEGGGGSPGGHLPPGSPLKRRTSAL
mmetsp:Transcript_67953/g.151779  ORF Transcript_67953/g.151779 Transcript_67953/m.151779 type:complete len:156 (-) Transcript_67953:112-579(-)